MEREKARRRERAVQRKGEGWPREGRGAREAREEVQEGRGCHEIAGQEFLESLAQE
jgi:hypothetical protein